MSYVQPWMMHPSSDHALPQVGNLPVSAYSSRGSPESSDYGSGSMSVIDMPTTDVSSNGRESQAAHNKDSHFLLRDKLQQQIEYYFSPQNLSKDTFLRSHMDGEHYVMVSLIAGFNCVRRLTQDVNLVTDAIRVSSKLELDDNSTKVRPKSNRLTVVIHDLPETVTREDLEGLFAKQTVVKPVNYECASPGVWYVEFEQENEAMEALRYLREDVGDYCGKPICTRIRAIPVAAGAVGVFKGTDTGLMAPVASPATEDSVHMARPPGAEMLQYPQYPFATPNGQYYAPNIMHPQVNPAFMMWPSHISYQDAYNMMAYNPSLMQMQQPAPPPPYRGGHTVSRGRGAGGRRGSSNGGYNAGNRRGRGESYPNSGRNSAMSETRSEHNHATSHAVSNRDGSRHGSFSSMNGNHRGAMSPSSVRSGENTPPHGPPVTMIANSQVRERTASTTSSVERRSTAGEQNSRRHLDPQPVQGKHGDNVGHAAQIDHAKAHHQSNFDFQPKMFPPLPGMPSSSDQVEPNTDGSQSGASQTNAHLGLNMSAADIVRGIHSMNVNPTSSKAWSEGDATQETHDKTSKPQRVDQVRSQKKEQGSSTDDLPKSGRELNEQRARVEQNAARTSRSNSSAGTQTPAMSAVPNTQPATSSHGSHLRLGPQSTQVSSPRQDNEHLPQMSKDLSPGSAFAKTYSSLSVGTDSTHMGLSDSGSGRSSAASHKESEDSGMAGRSGASSKSSAVENGKGSGTFSYARIAQMNRDKLLVPGQGAAVGANGPHGGPLMKQSSVDSSQEDRRSLVDKEHSISSAGSRSKPSSASLQDGRVQSARSVNGYDGAHSYQNGSASSYAGTSDGGENDDNEGFMEVTKHKHVQRQHPQQRSNGAMQQQQRRYAGGL